MATPVQNFLPEIVPMERITVQARIHDELRRMLMVGKFQPGQPLKINELAEAFGTSAQPVRESIRQLVAERALDALANRSARVPLHDRRQLEDLRRARVALEGLIAELAAEAATDADIDALAAIVDAEVAADEGLNIERSVSQNLDFHFALYRMSRSSVLPPILEGLWLQIGPNIRLAAEMFDAREGRGAELHVRTLEALRRRDGAAARAAIEADINRFFDLLARNPSIPDGPGAG